MSWTDTCGVCNAHRADCSCKYWDDVDGKYSKNKNMKNEDYFIPTDEDMEAMQRAEEKYDWDIKSLVKDNYVFFDSYRQGNFYYRLCYQIKDGTEQTNENYLFPVPIEDIGTATLMGTDRAITYMRWIRKAISDKTFIKI